jgi:hypothetical protein
MRIAKRQTVMNAVQQNATSTVLISQSPSAQGRFHQINKTAATKMITTKSKHPATNHAFILLLLLHHATNDFNWHSQSTVAANFVPVGAPNWCEFWIVATDAELAIIGATPIVPRETAPIPHPLALRIGMPTIVLVET